MAAVVAEHPSHRDAVSIGTLLAPRRIVHIAYFGFAIAALLALSLLVPGATTRAPLILGGGAALWAATVAVRYIWESRAAAPAPISLEPAHLFLVVLASTYVVFAFDVSSFKPQFSPSSPDSLPGLLINSHAYFVLVFVYMLIFIGWYGSERAHLLETALAVQVFLLSLMFESFLFLAASVPVLVLMAVALALVRALPWEGAARPVERSIVWLAVPLGVFLGAAVISTSAGDYPYASLTITARMAALSFFALMLFDGIREDRQRWLIWLALAAPAVTQGALVTLKVLDIARVLGFSYAFGNRIELASGVDPNPLGLSLATGVLLVAGAFPRIRTPGMRWIAIAALGLLLPALVVAYSVPSLMGLACGLVALAVLYALRSGWRAWSRPAALAAPGLFVLVGIVIIASYVVPAATRHGLRYTVDDPTTGRSRINLWTWSVRDFKDHLVLGVGPGYYRGRARYVQAEFPSRDVTKMLERRRLLGGDGTQWRVFVLTHPHNLVLGVAEGMGILGLLALVVVGAGATVGALRVLMKGDGEEWWLAAIGLALLVAAFVWSMTALGFNIAMLPLIGWLALGLVALAHRTADDRPLVMPRLIAGANVRRGIAIAGGVAVLLVLVVRPVGSLAAFKIGRDRVTHGAIGTSETPLKIAAALDPLEATALQWVVFRQLQYGETSQALASLNDADSRLPRDPVILAQLGDVSWLSGDTQAAEQYYRRSIASDRWEAAGRDAYTPLALLEAAEGRRDEAIQTLADGFFVNPANVYDGAWVRATDGSTVMLDDAYLHGSDPGPNNGLMAALDGRLGLFTGANRIPVPGALSITNVFDAMESQAHAELPRDRTRGTEMLHQIGLAYHYAGLHAGGRRLLEDAVLLDLGATYIRYDLAQVELALKDDDGAIRDLSEVVRLAETSSTYDLRQAFAERALAVIAARQKRFADAITLMQAALDHYRWAYLPSAYPTLADAYDASGQPAKAAEYRARERYLTRQ